MAAYEIELENIGMEFSDADGNNRRILSDVNLKIQKGEFVSLLGPSGCGKTTLLRIMADLIKPTSGSATIAGMDTHAARVKHKYGMVFQSAVLYDWRTVEENVALPLELLKVPKKEQREMVQNQLQMVGLGSHGHKYPHQLSGGMQQRVGIARALALNPDILFMDEPFSALDEFTKERLHADILRIWESTNKTIVFVTHNIGEAVFLSDRVCVLSANPARLSAVVDIPLPRPRTPITLETQEYFDLLTHTRELFKEDYHENR